jgi:hypothetical protein
MRIRLVLFAVILIAILLTVGVAVNSFLKSGERTTTSLTETGQSSFCCVDPQLTQSTPCSQIQSANYSGTQRLISSIEASPNFIAAENGSNFVGPGGWGCVFGTPDSILLSVSFDFYYITNRTFIDNCNSTELFTYYLNTNIQLTPSGYNMSSLTIEPSNSSEQTASCSSTPSIGTTS